MSKQPSVAKAEYVRKSLVRRRCGQKGKGWGGCVREKWVSMTLRSLAGVTQDGVAKN